MPTLHSHIIAILAYNNHASTERNVRHLIELGYHDDILLFDNGSDPSFKSFASEVGVSYHREESNLFVNPAWNYLFDTCDCDYLTLLNNDCFILSDNYFDEVILDMVANGIGLSSCLTSHVDIGPPLEVYEYFNPDEPLDSPLRFNPHSARQGWLMTIDLNAYRGMDSHIPDYLKIMAGDDWIWDQFVKSDMLAGVYENMYAIHASAATSSLSEFLPVIADDLENLRHYGDWYYQMAEHLRPVRNVMIGTLTYDAKIPIEWVESLLGTIALCGSGLRNIRITPIMIKGEHFIDRGRNDLLHFAKMHNVDDLIYIDSDTLWNPEDLLKLLDHPVEVCGAIARQKRDEVVFRVNLIHGNETSHYDESLGMWKVFSLGGCFLRLNKSAISKVWDKCEKYIENRGDDRGGERALAFECSFDHNRSFTSEDVGFANNWIEKCGGDMWLDSSIILAHKGDVNFIGDPDQWVRSALAGVEDAEED